MSSTDKGATAAKTAAKQGMEGKPLKSGMKSDSTSTKPGKKGPPMTPAEEAWDITKTILLAVAITLVFRMVAWQPFNIPSGSMRPNLLVGDFIVVSKFEYGYSRASLIFPFTRMDIGGRLFGSEPELGDVIVFKNTRDRHRDYIKRLVGKPGDEIRIIGGVLHINGTRVQREFISNDTINCPHGGTSASFRETLPNGVSYDIQECQGNRGPRDNVGPYIVPEDHYFLMGDNRDNSQDSRTPQVGYVHKDQIVGKAQRLVFSVDGAKSRIWEIWNWPRAIRYGRLFDPVD